MTNKSITIAESIDHEMKCLKDQIEGAIRNFQSRTGLSVSIHLLHHYENKKLIPADSIVILSIEK